MASPVTGNWDGRITCMKDCFQSDMKSEDSLGGSLDLAICRSGIDRTGKYKMHAWILFGCSRRRSMLHTDR